MSNAPAFDENICYKFSEIIDVDLCDVGGVPGLCGEFGECSFLDSYSCQVLRDQIFAILAHNEQFNKNNVAAVRTVLISLVSSISAMHDLLLATNDQNRLLKSQL